MSTLPPIPNAPLRNRWYYTDASNQRCGPITFDELQRLAKNGVVQSETHVFMEGETEWKKFSEVANLTPPPILDEPKPDAWYYADTNGKPFGPMPFDRLESLAMAGKIKAGTLVTEDHKHAWRPFSEVAPILFPSTLPIPLPNSPRWPIILALVLIWPYGVHLLWKSDAFSEKAKKNLTGVVVLGCIFAAFAGWLGTSGTILSGIIAGWLIWESNVSKQFKVIRIGGVAVIALLGLALNSGKPQRPLGDASPSTSSTSSPANAGTPRRSSDDRFEVGQEVTVPARTGLTHNGDLLREVVLERNEEKQNELLEQLVRESVVSTTEMSAKIIDVDREDGLCKIETRNGVTWWVKQSKLEGASAPTSAHSTLPNMKHDVERKLKRVFDDRLESVEVFSNADGGWNVLAKFKRTESFTRKLEKERIEQEMGEAYKSLFTSELDIRTACLAATATLIDPYGNKNSGIVYKTSLDKETALKIEWKNIEDVNFSALWETQSLFQDYRR